MKARRTVIAICILAALLPALLIIIGISERGALPASLEPYADTLTVRCASGDEFTYEKGDDGHAILLALIGDAERAERADAEEAAEHYDKFELLLDGERSLSLTLYISGDADCGFIMTERGRYYSATERALLDFLKTDAAACLWVGEAPPKATLGSIELKSSVVEWSRLLPDGTRVSSGEYISRTPTEYSVSSHADITPSFADQPSATIVVVYDSDGKRYFEGTADELPYIQLPIDRALSVMYSAEWESPDASRVRAAYSFLIQSGNE